MARRRTSKIEVSMFPFLSVLCSVIGVLMLFILLIVSSRVIAEVEPEPVIIYDPPPPPPIYGPRESGVTDDEYERLEGQIQTLAEELLARQQELQDLQKVVTNLEDLITTKEDEELEPEPGEGRLLGVQVDKPEDVSFEPVENVRVTKKPRFIEITSEGFIVHPEKDLYPVEQLRAKRTSDFKRFLARVHRQRRKEYLLLLVHPNGITAHNELKTYMIETFPHKDHSGTQSEVGMGSETFSPGWLLISEQLEKNAKQPPK